MVGIDTYIHLPVPSYTGDCATDMIYLVQRRLIFFRTETKGDKIRVPTKSALKNCRRTPCVVIGRHVLMMRKRKNGTKGVKSNVSIGTD